MCAKLLHVVAVLCGVVSVCGFQQQYFRVVPRNTRVIEGSEAILQCAVANLAGQVQWAKDGFALGYSSVIPGFPRHTMFGDRKLGVYNLRIVGATLQDAGEYQCQVGPASQHKVIRANASLVVLAPPTSVEILGHPPGSRLEVRQGADVALECRVRDARPPAQLLWHKGSQLIKGDRVSKEEIRTVESADGNPKTTRYTTVSRLQFKASADDDYADFTCEARHEALPRDNPLRSSVQFSVLYPPGAPYIEGYTPGDTVRAGQTVELVCRSRGGNPPAQLVWYRNQEQVRMAYRTSGRMSENVLSFVASAADNKARYTCEAKNVMISDTLKAEVDLTVLFAPTHVTISGASEARVGDAVSLSCATSASNPAAAVKWVVAGKQQRGEGNETAIAPEGGWITKSNITVVIEPQRRSVVVVCHGINAQLTDSVVATHTIHVFYPPSTPIITGYVPGTTLAAGAVQKLQCISTGGNPLATLTWYKNDKKIHSQSKTTDKSVSAEVSILTNVSDNMAVYRCAATNSATTVPLIDSVTLSVHFAPETVKVRVEPTELTPGTEARLYCDAASSNPPAQLSWWRDGIPVQGLPMQMKKGLHGGTVSSIELKLNVSKEHNGAVYTCQAMNEALQRSVHDALALKVLYAPIFDVPSPPPSLGVENQTLTITATATGSPDNIVYTWTRDGLPITRSQYTQNERIISVGSSLTISSVSRHDAGVYTVEATNSRGAAASNVTLIVQYSASIKSVSQNGITSPNEDAILTCTADGFPLNSEHIRWERAGYEIDPSKISFDPKNLTSYLLIENPTRQDVGNFTCIVNNGLGRESRREVMLVVPFKPEMDAAPSLAKVAANTGQSVELTCRCQAAPQPTFTWTKDNTPLPVNTSTKYTSKTYRNSLTYTSVLVINAVTSKDYGSYKCEASNYLGGESANVELTATAPPDMVGPLTVVNVTQSTITISWSAGFDGGLPVRYRVRYRKIYDESYRYEDVTPRNATHFTVTGLERGTAYLLSVMAINRIGQSKYRPDDTSATTLASSNPGELSIRPSEHGDMSNGAIVYVSVTAAILVIVNAGLVACFLLKRRSRRLKEQAGQASKAATIEMYAPSSYNETVTGDTLSSVSDKSETYSEPAGCPPVPAMPRTQPQDTYLTDPGLVLPPPLDYPDYPPDYALHARTLPRQRDMQNKVTYAPAPSPMPPLDGSYYNMSSDRYLSYPPLIGEYLSQQANRPPMSGYATTPRPHVLREENEMSVDAPQGYEVDVSERQSLSGTLGRRPALSAAPPPPDVTRTQLHNSPQHPATPPTVKQPQSILKCPNRTKQNNYDYGSPLSSSSPQNTAQILTVHNLSNEVPHYGTIRKDKNKQTLN